MHFFSFIKNKFSKLKESQNHTEKRSQLFALEEINTIYEACKSADLVKLKECIEQGGKFDFDNAGLYPLHYLMMATTSIENKSEILKILKTLPQFNINQRSVYDDVAPIELASVIENQAQGIRDISLLLANGADPTVFDAKKNNILHLALYEERFGTAYFLISKMPELSRLKNIHQQSPLELIYAAKAEENTSENSEKLSTLIECLSHFGIYPS